MFKKTDRWKPSKEKDKKGTMDFSSKKYRAVIDKNTSIEILKDKEIIYWIIKKDLVDYENFLSASEAPISNLYNRGGIDSFEACIGDKAILEKEIFPIADAIRTVFNSHAMELDKISIAIGSNEKDYVTVDESDLKNIKVEPTLFGLQEFIEKNKDGILGFGIREYDHEKGNLIFLKSKIVRPNKNIIFIDLYIISSIQQRGYYIQKDHSWIGIQKYIVIKTTKLDDEKLLQFLEELEINWEIIFLRRTLAVNDWTEIECENNASNLKTYLRHLFPMLGYLDIQQIVKIVEGNQLNFKITVRMAELLNKQKKELLKNEHADVTYRPIEKAEIVAAANLAMAYHGEKKEIKFDDDVRMEDILRFEKILANL
ncbi:MAG: hypothetical protein ACFFCS_18600 [Candidatus Hodarchaeota archaeon]